jgi:2-polyprenyl-3-methyl-5-hydroxy-6-metoxy-1,4-benzoquinol methylase
MTAEDLQDFAPIADSLRRRVRGFYAEHGESLDDPAGLNTLETNSGFVERRAAPLIEMITRDGTGSLAGRRLLDLGCGFGALSAYFAAHGATVTGIDPVESRLEVGRAVAAEHGLAVELRPGRMESLELGDESFDLVVQNNSLCYIVSREDRQRALVETRRVLKPGGLVVIRNPNRWHPRDQFTGLPLIQLLPPRQAGRLAELAGRPRSTVRLTSPLEGMRELRRAGFGEVAQVASPASRWPGFMKPFARYQHLTARRP